MNNGIIIAKDSREHDGKGWVFRPDQIKKSGKVPILGMEIKTLDAGDYSIVGAEDLVRIERKAGFSELFGNMIPVVNKERFEREMEKLRLVKHKWILIESYLCHDIMGMCPMQLRGPTSSKVFEWLSELELEYDIHVMFVGECGERIAKTIFQNVAKRYSL